MLALLDVGRTPVSLALKPDGGELIVCNFDADSISIIETGNDEVGSSLEIGQHPSRGLVTADNSRLYVTNFGSNSIAIYDIDIGRRIGTLNVGSHPDGIALTPDQHYILVLDTQSGDVTVIQKRSPREPRAHGVFAADHDPRRLPAERDRGEVVHAEREEVESRLRVSPTSSQISRCTVCRRTYRRRAFRSAAIAGASRDSISRRGIIYTSCPSRRIAIDGDDGGYPVK